MLLGTAAVLAGYGVGAAQAQTVVNPNYTYGPYVGAAGGGSFLNDISPNGGGADTKSEFDNGWVGLGTVGWGFGNGFRAELEGSYRRNDVRSVRGSAGAPNGGALGTTAVMVNGLYDIDPTALFGIESYGFMPHVGVGVGWARPRFDNAHVYNGNVVSGKDDVLAYQGIAGVSYAVAPQIKVDLDYRYFGTQSGTFASSPGLSGIGSPTKTSIGDQTVTLGIRYEFWAPQVAQAPLPAVAPPPPAPPAKAPEVQRAFQVFFDFNKSDISAAASKVIQQASDSVRAGNLTRINVTGHTDTVGSAKYNQALSEKRAAAVKAQLIADGVPDSEISTSGVGKSNLLVPTADSVREPQNRRAEIVLQ
ncbi:membrane protein [Aliidongia dinghuensis]|uniref:Membrane protein n=2 Tax=Aliidongia dinghuensis TaxID=1867774 RepID=A0A8J2YVS9_9PROT|nr:membrane protein [Aliidongia dinghuensis]